MLILVFSDIHLDFEAVEILKKIARKVDYVLCCGDISRNEEGIDKILKEINEFGKDVYIVPGNNERPEILEKYCKDYENIHPIHGKIVELDDYLLVGFGGSIGNIGVFTWREDSIREFFGKIKDNVKNKDVILLTHTPPKNTILSKTIFGDDLGSEVIRKFIEEVQPIFHFCGHVHEKAYHIVRIGRTICINPGKYGIVVEL